MTSEKVKQLALKAGAARFYPDKQKTVDDCYIVSRGFLERFAEEIRQATLEDCKIELPDVVTHDVDPGSYYRGMVDYE